MWKVYRRDPTPFPLDVGISHHDEATPKCGGYAWARGASPLFLFRDYSVTGGAMPWHRKRSHLSRHMALKIRSTLPPLPLRPDRKRPPRRHHRPRPCPLPGRLPPPRNHQGRPLLLLLRPPPFPRLPAPLRQQLKQTTPPHPRRQGPRRVPGLHPGRTATRPSAS